MKVLCYMPYNRWALHGQWEMTILHSLRLRGAEVSYVLCDGLYSDCDVHWAATDPRTPGACERCQAQVTSLVAGMGMEFRWLGRWLDPQDARDARAWAAALPLGELLDARFDDHPLGEWIRSSTHTHLRRSHLDPADPQVEAVLRSYLYSAAVASRALARLLDDERPDALLLFNARMSSLRVCFELARARGIRTVIHERGARDESLLVRVDAHPIELGPVRDWWSAWRDVPLTREEAEAAVGLVEERRHGKNTGWHAFTGAPTEEVAQVRAELRLDPARPTWLLFTSSDDEIAADTDWFGAYVGQDEWLADTIAFAARHPELDLVVRGHPNTGSKRSTGVNESQLQRLRALFADVPPNVRFVDPTDEVSTYTLMDLADAGLAMHSTAGMEMAAQGKPVVMAAPVPFADDVVCRSVATREDYPAVLERLAAEQPAPSLEVRRHALRFIHLNFFRSAVDFPLVHMPDPATGQLRWRTTAELRPGLDAGLDRMCRMVLEGEPVVPDPTPAERARDASAETAVLVGTVQVVAHARDLLADPALLRAWGDAFGAGDPVTLAVVVAPDELDPLVAAIAAAGLDGEDGPDLLAVPSAPTAAVAAYASVGDLEALRGLVPVAA